MGHARLAGQVGEQAHLHRRELRDGRAVATDDAGLQVDLPALERQRREPPAAPSDPIEDLLGGERRHQVATYFLNTQPEVP